MQQILKQNAYLTIKQISKRTEAVRRRQRWGLPLSGKLKKELEAQSHKEFERDVINILNGSLGLADSPDYADTPAVRLAYEQTAKEIMGVSSEFIGIEALKQVSASIYSDDPKSLGVDLKSLAKTMQECTLVQDEQDCLALLNQAIAIQTDPNLRFTFNDSITGAIADTLNFALASPMLQARLARLEATQIERAIRTAPQQSVHNPVRI